MGTVRAVPVEAPFFGGNWAKKATQSRGGRRQRGPLSQGLFGGSARAAGLGSGLGAGPGGGISRSRSWAVTGRWGSGGSAGRAAAGAGGAEPEPGSQLRARPGGGTEPYGQTRAESCEKSPVGRAGKGSPKPALWGLGDSFSGSNPEPGTRRFGLENRAPVLRFSAWRDSGVVGLGAWKRSPSAGLGGAGTEAERSVCRG